MYFRVPVGEQVVIRFCWGPRDALFSEADIGRLVVPEPSGFPPEQRIDWIHDVDVDELLNPKERPR